MQSARNSLIFWRISVFSAWLVDVITLKKATILLFKTFSASQGSRFLSYYDPSRLRFEECSFLAKVLLVSQYLRQNGFSSYFHGFLMPLLLILWVFFLSFSLQVHLFRFSFGHLIFVPYLLLISYFLVFFYYFCNDESNVFYARSPAHIVTIRK